MAFERGKSGNPAGRKPGTPNKATVAVRDRIANEADPLAFLQRIMEGQPLERRDDRDETALPSKVYPQLADSVRAAQILAGKLAPDAKDRAIRFDVGRIESPKDAHTAVARIVEAMAAGDVTPSEAATVIGVVKSYTDIWQATDLEERLSKIEAEKGTA